MVAVEGWQEVTARIAAVVARIPGSGKQAAGALGQPYSSFLLGM